MVESGCASLERNGGGGEEGRGEPSSAGPIDGTVRSEGRGEPGVWNHFFLGVFGFCRPPPAFEKQKIGLTFSKAIKLHKTI